MTVYYNDNCGWMLDFQISIKSLFDAKNEVYMLKLSNFMLNTQVWHQ